MKIQCSERKNKYHIDDHKVPDVGAKIKCPVCKNIINVGKPKHEPPVLTIPNLVEPSKSEKKMSLLSGKYFS